MADNSINIVIGGEAGQGLVTVGQLLSRSLVRSGLHIVVTQDYQSRIRGGHNTFAIRASSSRIEAPGDSIDLLVALNEETLRLHREELAEGTSVIADESFDTSCSRCFGVPFKELSEPKFSNVVALGVASCLLGLDRDVVLQAVTEAFGKKGADVIKTNSTALDAAYEWAGKQESSVPKLEDEPDAPRRLMVSGNEAIALGALSAGLKLLSFYPMTPSTSVALTIIKHAGKMGVVVEQAEDEISAINMAIGASFAGAPSMVTTSGGGFALMNEAVSLAGMIETPLVVVVAQRPGPATGLPTRTEQADLEFVLHAGHGEFPHAMFTPGTVEECFYLTNKAFQISEKYQTPAFVLTDQFLADSFRALDGLDVDKASAVQAGSSESDVSLPYRRFEITECGISPRLLPGTTGNLVVADSDEHTEDGHLTEDLTVRQQMADKRLRKFDGLLQDVIPPSFSGDERPDILLLSWGSTKGSVSEVAGDLRFAGSKVATLHFAQVWPLVPDQFIAHLKGAARVISVEGNATAQLARLITRETGFEIDEHVLRYDGLPITPEFIRRKLKVKR